MGRGTAEQLCGLVGHICPHTSTAPSLHSHLHLAPLGCTQAAGTTPHPLQLLLQPCGSRGHGPPRAPSAGPHPSFCFPFGFVSPQSTAQYLMSQQAVAEHKHGERRFLTTSPITVQAQPWELLWWTTHQKATTAGTFLSRVRGRLHQAPGLGFLPKQKVYLTSESATDASGTSEQSCNMLPPESHLLKPKPLAMLVPQSAHKLSTL